MKCTASQLLSISNENCNNTNTNLLSGIAGGPNLIDLNGLNPSPIIQHPTANRSPQATSGPVALLKSTTSTGSADTSVCGSCVQKISDRYIMKVVDTPYHERCLQCVSCCCNLMHSCFVRDGKLYCRIDYERWDLILLKNSREL